MSIGPHISSWKLLEGQPYNLVQDVCSKRRRINLILVRIGVLYPPLYVRMKSNFVIFL